MVMRVGRVLVTVGAVFAATLGVSACAPQPPAVDAVAPTPTSAAEVGSTSAESASEQITFVSVVDGDTIETSAGTVRIIGIDTPERGECGADDASGEIETQLAPGDTLTLELPAGENDQDQYGRLIRYATTTAGVDLGLLQLQGGNAVARYDSSDGYPAHPREVDYHAAQLATLGSDGSVMTVACQAAAAVPPPTAVGGWWEQYSSCTKLKKNAVGHPTGPFNRDDPAQAEPFDWFANRTGNGGDGDGDGLACE
ncbi:thermonuclease family protein [Microbacterium sp. PRC9]|uniref:thermonuclease family protein n=1 Tax=Microbacterium sp. PRC9 TaxID=2962591 RepID=UPI002882C1E4|nr:thermonuclease family protein [Microbacterium sp. PRC9]MDT0143223.1 thermonuclease family protein [Microbacterium sp. PRC9]